MSVKKEPAASRSLAEAELAASQSAEAELQSLIARFAPGHLRLISAMRLALRRRLPSSYELVYEYRDAFVISFSPSEHGYEGVLAIRAGEGGVKLYFNRGKELPDPEKLLRGSGKLVRFIIVDDETTLARPAVVSLLDQAIARNPVPFPIAGPGPVVIRSTKASRERPGLA